MIKSLIADNFRSFPHFEMHGLGHVNLLVGMNNCGKTSLLEAIHMAATGIDPQTLWSIATRRGELFVDDTEPGFRRPAEIDISPLFHGFKAEIGSCLRLVASGPELSETCNMEIIEGAADLQRRLFTSTGGTTTTPQPVGDWVSISGNAVEDVISGPELALKVTLGEAELRPLFLSQRGGLPFDRMRSRRTEVTGNERNVVFVPTAGLMSSSLVSMVDDLILTPLEDLALQAMQTLDDRIERLAPKGGDRRPRIMVRLKGANKPLPVGSLGDGVNRLLTIAVGLAKSSNGILLIDEIDTGLHFTTMDRMWQLVSAAAEKLDVQVFATTHSRDCVESLAVICRREASSENRVSIQRIEPDKPKAIPFSEREIIAAAERGIEIR